ncbi:RNA-binding transcriptional accessory protein, partial [Escherichia coli]|nr:RNA-binding transcriptional accessory protein [Escherichia coli]
APYIEAAYLDSYKRFIGPAIEREIRNELTEKADEQAIAIFGENLRNLLLQSPLKGNVVLGFDPAYRTGCKLAVVDETGKVLAIQVIYPHKPATAAKR